MYDLVAMLVTCTTITYLYAQGIINCSLHGQHMLPPQVLRKSLISGHGLCIYLHTRLFSFAMESYGEDKAVG